MKAGQDAVPTEEPKTAAEEFHPVERDETEVRVGPAGQPVVPDGRVLTCPDTRLRITEKNTLRITEENTVRVPLVDFVVSNEPTEELVDMEQLENLERLGKVWLRRQQRAKADSLELD